jgi:two-component system OmpR family response regulator
MHPFQSVLCVDDDPHICEVVQAALGLIAGLDVHIAHRGEQAVDLAYRRRPDLVLMDVMMPGLDGLAALQRMREGPLTAAIPVIFLTAKVSPAEVRHLCKLGAIGVIGKPFDPRKLHDSLVALWNGADPPAGIRAQSPVSQVAAPADSLGDRFLRRSRDDVIHLHAMIERARRGERSVFKEIERLAHSIHGAGSMFGFPAISASGGAIERLVEMVTADATPPVAAIGPALLQQLVDGTERLAREIETAGLCEPSRGLLAASREVRRTAAPMVRVRPSI